MSVVVAAPRSWELLAVGCTVEVVVVVVVVVVAVVVLLLLVLVLFDSMLESILRVGLQLGRVCGLFYVCCFIC